MSDLLYPSPDDSLTAESSSSFDPAAIVQLVLARWRPIAIITILGLIGGLAHFFLTPAQYQARTVVQIEQTSPLGISSSRNPWLEAWASMKYYPTQYWLLRSRGLAERAVLNLRLAEDPAFNPPRSRSEPPSGSADADAAQTARLANRILAGLTIDPLKETELVQIRYTASDARLAARVVNGIADAYIDWAIETRSQAVGKTSRFLQEQVDEIKLQIEEKERELQEYSRTSDIVTIEPSSNLTLQQLERLNADLVTAQKDRIEKEVALNELAAAPKESVADKQSGGLINDLRREQVRREQEYESKLQTYTPDWPAMVTLKAEIDEGARTLERKIEESFEEARKLATAEYQSARRREQSLRNTIERVKSEAMDMNQLSVEFNNLQMEISAKRELQDDLLRRLSETGVSERLSSGRVSNIRVVERALVPSSPFRPSLRVDLTVGLSVGLMVGVGLVLLLHFLDRTVKTPEEVERLLDIPVLGVIPDINEGTRAYGYRSYYGYGSSRSASETRQRQDSKIDPRPDSIELMPALKPRLAVSEAYRSIRTALLLSTAQELKAITITSAESGEGKTATAANLGIVMAQLGRRVLLIDADLRKPRVHKVFKTSNRDGLVSYLTNQLEVDSTCHETSYQNLWVCPSGPHPPNPSELLASERMRQFLEAARTRFDFVVVDSPPVLPVTDGVLIGSIVDGVVLCLRANKVHREDARSCCERLRLAEVKILGAVLNRYRPSRTGSYGRRYHYYESYVGQTDGEVSDSAA